MLYNALDSAASSAPASFSGFIPEYLPNPKADKRPLQDVICEVLNEQLADDVLNLDLHGKSTLAENLIIASGKAARHLDALAEKLRRSLTAHGHKEPSVEGRGDSGWVIVDAGDTIVHLFRSDTRKHYNLERMWGATFAAE